MFLNAVMLVGAAAAVLPVVLHLLSRSRYKTVDWGAMMFLEGADADQQRARRLNQWVLLLIRMAMIALLAVALARPVVRGRYAAPAEGQRVLAVLLLDCSASMGFDENGVTRMTLAKGAARQVLEAHRGDHVSLVLMGHPQDSADRHPTTDLWDVAQRINAAEPGVGRADVAAALEDALAVVEAATSPAGGDVTTDPRRKPFVRFYVISDRQASGWRGVDAAFAAAWKDRLARTGTAARVFAIPAGSADADNVAVESIELLNGPAVANQPAELEVRLRNYGTVQWASLPLTVRTDRKPLFDERVSLAPESTATFRVPVKEGFPSPGTHVVTAEINRQPADGAAPATAPAPQRGPGFVADDKLETVVEVINPIRVLVISGDEGAASGVAASGEFGGFYGGEADYLQPALAPYRAARRRGPDLAAVDVVPAEAWTGTTVPVPAPKKPGEPAGAAEPKELRDVKLGAYQVVILANVEQFTAAQVRAVEQFVYDGGGLLVAPGNLSRPQAYNDALYRDGSGVLPAALDEPTAGDGMDTTSLSGFDPEHPVFRFLDGRPDPFLSASVFRYFPLSATSPAARKIGYYVSGDPFLLESQAGRGRVLLMTAPLDADWTTLPLTNFYLPFVQSAVRHLADTSIRKPNLLPGQPIEVPLEDPPPPGQQRRVVVRLPDESEKPAEILRPGDLAVARFTDTDQPGRYEVRITRPGRRTSTLHFVVLAPRDESDLTPLSPDRWKELETLLHLEKVDPSERPLTAAAVTSPGTRELWVWALGGVLALAVAEMALTRWWARDPAEDESAGPPRAA